MEFMIEDTDNQETNNEAVGTRNDDRLKLMESFADKADELRNDEFVDVETEELKERPFKLALDDEGNPLGSDRSDKDDPEPKVKFAEEVKKYKLTINGQQREFTEEEIIARASKVEAADEYLAEAARHRQKANQVQQQEDDTEKDIALARAIQMGSEEEAAAAIRQLRSRPSVSPDDVAKIVSAQTNFQEAASRFTKEYSDLWEDPRMRKMLGDEDARLLSQGDKRAHYERFKSIGDDMRKWRDGLHKTDSSFEEKRQKKASVNANPPTASMRKAATVSEEQDETPSDVIAKMARSRGQI